MRQAIALATDRSYRDRYILAGTAVRVEKMSDPRSKTEHSKAKDLRQGVVELAARSPNSHPKKLARPWKIMSIFPGLSAVTGSDVFCAHRSPTREDAEAWVEKTARRGIMEAADYWIEGPHERNSKK